MGNALVMHIDEAPWIGWGGSAPDAIDGFGQQLIGDAEKGPWIYLINVRTPNFTVDAHSHSEDEVIYIVEGQLTVGDRVCTPGTVIFFEKETDYGFTTGPEGVRFMNIRPGPTHIRSKGGEWKDEAPSP